MDTNDDAGRCEVTGMTGRWIAAAMCGAALFVGIDSVGPRPADARTAAAPVPRCMNVQLSVSPGGGLGAATGHLGVWFRLHNLRRSACSLQGFPGVELLDKNFQSLPDPVQRSGYMISPSLPKRMVVLDRSHDAYFALEYGDVPNMNHPCRSGVPYVMVIPPNDRLPIVGYARIGYQCFGDRVDVSPVLPARALR